MIEQLKDFPVNVPAFVCKGHVSKADYDEVVVPAVQQALKAGDKVRLYYETAADFSGIDPSAIWTDFKVGVAHLARWDRVAVVTDIDWIKHAMPFFSFMMPGEMKIFPLAEADRARDWVIAGA